LAGLLVGLVNGRNCSLEWRALQQLCWCVLGLPGRKHPGSKTTPGKPGWKV